ncbi:glycerophosphodiester phosphodiesterase family protein [Companilactobacillus paralimentarius]|uniref:glycerophosphodiester phosphodiesterase family protein n=1 Tax=Companilactobacillus paralimentarius TaxID=83526 RepID=UPI0038509F19
MHIQVFHQKRIYPILYISKAHATNPDFVEIDIQKTKDGQYVLSHDSTIESVTKKKY